MPQRSFHFKKAFGNKYSQSPVIYDNGHWAGMESITQRWFLILICVITFKPPFPSNIEPEQLQCLILVDLPFILADDPPIKML